MLVRVAHVVYAPFHFVMLGSHVRTLELRVSKLQSVKQLAHLIDTTAHEEHATAWFDLSRAIDALVARHVARHPRRLHKLQHSTAVSETGTGQGDGEVRHLRSSSQTAREKYIFFQHTHKGIIFLLCVGPL